MRRRVHLIKAWVALHPHVFTVLAAISGLLAVIALVLTVWLHSQENAKFNAQKEAQRVANVAAARAAKASSAAIRHALCPLVYAYVHPVPGTDQTGRADQIDAGWHAIGALIGCPNGEAPKG